MNDKEIHGDSLFLTLIGNEELETGKVPAKVRKRLLKAIKSSTNRQEFGSIRELIVNNCDFPKTWIPGIQINQFFMFEKLMMESNPLIELDHILGRCIMLIILKELCLTGGSPIPGYEEVHIHARQMASYKGTYFDCTRECLKAIKSEKLVSSLMKRIYSSKINQKRVLIDRVFRALNVICPGSKQVDETQGTEEIRRHMLPPATETARRLVTLVKTSEVLTLQQAKRDYIRLALENLKTTRVKQDVPHLRNFMARATAVIWLGRQILNNEEEEELIMQTVSMFTVKHFFSLLHSLSTTEQQLA